MGAIRKEKRKLGSCSIRPRASSRQDDVEGTEGLEQESGAKQKRPTGDSVVSPAQCLTIGAGQLGA
jgi:hypothetical protein